MGKTAYPDTNNQYAYRTDRAGFLARIKAKADALWLDGYRATVYNSDLEPFTFLVYKETEGIEAGHKVKPAEGVCTCKFFADQYKNPLDLKQPDKTVACKHLGGVKSLVVEEIAYWKGLEQQAELRGDRERAARYAVIWNTLEAAWTQAMAAWYRQRAA